MYESITMVVLLISATRWAVADELKNSNLLTYESDFYQLTIQYPTNWKKLEPIPGSTHNHLIVSFTPSAPSKGNRSQTIFTVQIYNSSGISLAKFIIKNLNNLTRHDPEFVCCKMISENETSIAGTLSSIRIFTFKDSTGEFKMMRIYMPYNNNIYVLTYLANISTYDDNLKTIQRMMNSLKIMTTAKAI